MEKVGQRGGYFPASGVLFRATGIRGLFCGDSVFRNCRFCRFAPCSDLAFRDAASCARSCPDYSIAQCGCFLHHALRIFVPTAGRVLAR